MSLSTSGPTPDPEKRDMVAWLKIIGPIIAVVISAFSLCVSIGAISVAECHYNELTKPHAQSEEVRDKLAILKGRIELFQSFVNSLVSDGNLTGEDMNMQWALNTSQYLYLKAEDAYTNSRYEESNSYIMQAYTWIEGSLPTSAIIHIPGVDGTTAIRPFQGYTILGIDETTTLTTEEGEPLDTITATAYVGHVVGRDIAELN